VARVKRFTFNFPRAAASEGAFIPVRIRAVCPVSPCIFSPSLTAPRRAPFRVLAQRGRDTLERNYYYVRVQSRDNGRRARSFAPAGSTTRPLIDRASVEIASTVEFINTTVARRYIAKRSPIERRPRDLQPARATGMDFRRRP